MSAPVFSPGTIATVLRCPKCNGDNLHQRRVYVHCRTEEDGPGFCGDIGPGGASVRDLHADSPLFLGRRDDLVIEFMCEHCDDPTATPKVRFRLAIWQHKGTTFVEWLPTPVGET